MTDYKDIDYKDTYKQALKIARIHELRHANPDKEYYGHRIDAAYDPDKLILKKHLDEGWAIVMDSEIEVANDYDSFKDKPKVSVEKPTPLISKGKGIEVFLWLQKDKKKAYEDRAELARQQSAGVKAHQIKRGREVMITDPIIANAETKNTN